MPDGVHKVARQNLKTTLSKCTYFQQWHGNSWSEAQAAARIYLGGLPRPASGDEHTKAELQALRPYALIYTETESGLTFTPRSAGAGQELHFIPSGVLVIELERDVDEADPGDNEAVEEAIVSEADLMLWAPGTGDVSLTTQAGLAGRLAMLSLSGHGPFRTPTEYRARYGDAVTYFITIEWGTG